MKKLTLLLAVCLFSTGKLFAQDPILTNWWFNTTGNTYNGILTDVEAVFYNATKVYVKTSGVPNYYLDGQSVNDAADKNAIWVIKRDTQAATTPTGIQGGQSGIMLDGSVCFHPGDAQSYNNANVWFRLAYYFEQQDMDNYNGHSTPNDHIYHHHFDNLALNTTGSTVHSPLVGYAWDGYPIYGSYGYTNPDGTGGISRMKTSYQKYTYTTRTNGPNVGGQYPIGCFIEDWHYVAGSGDLDEHNGRHCKTPEYPNGVYAYFTTIDATGAPEYPYFIGPTYYGTFGNENLGPNGGNPTIPGDTTLYVPTTASAKEAVAAIESDFKVFPVPVADYLTIEPKVQGNYKLVLYDAKGSIIVNKQIHTTDKLNMTELPYGMYFIQVSDVDNNRGFAKRIVKR